MNGWARLLRQDAFVFAHAPEMRAALEADGLSGWADFAASWDSLGMDTYMADGGRYRKRRHAAFHVAMTGATKMGATKTGATEMGAARVARKPHQPHYQSRDYNALNGGIARWFDPILPEVASGPAFMAIMQTCTRLFDGLTPAPGGWHVEAHQFRIEARADQAGRPTPEGMHQDGVDWVLVLMIGRLNIAAGATTIHGLDRGLLGSFTLTAPMDAALLDDHRVLHGVTPVQPLDPSLPAHRDVLVVTYRRESLPGL